jgi:hypothetical protein
MAQAGLLLRRTFMKCLLVGTLLLSVVPAQGLALTLGNPAWRIELDPDNLALSVAAGGQQMLPVSRGVQHHTVTGLQVDAQQADWSWPDAHLSVHAQLDGADLLISLRAAQPGRVPILDQPASALGRALILPRGEGQRIPADHPGWREALVKQGELNSSEDLSLPLWTLQHSQFTLSWLLLNPFNNQLRFQADSQAFSLQLSHTFTVQNLSQPMELLLHLQPGSDLLSGAKHYRHWLQQQGKFVALSSKLQHNPDNATLLGASHIYLWGNGPLSVADVRNPGELLRRLRSNAPFINRLRSRFDQESKQVLRAAGTEPDNYQLQLLVRAINQAMEAEARSSWQTAAPDWTRLGRGYLGLMQQLQQAFGAALLADRAQWGGGLSLRTLNALRHAGLPRLWLGVDNWEAGLWHPETVRSGVRAGYLLGAYDSYATSIPPGQRPDWTTAQLGGEVHQRCGIVRANGTMQTGFQQTGYYTNPLCVQPLLKARISALLAATGFNSWFLDVYGAGMVFDDYRRGQSMSQRQMADTYVDNMAWVAATYRLPLGSENGNAVTARALVFAHGMQAPVIGWGDIDMSRLPSSRYFVGRWYPPEQPEQFFRPVPLKPEYLLTTFDPRYRIPLYQAVFHDSVISSNHWLNDNFKFSNADSDNRLAQMLYNVPPLYHLSPATLGPRLKRIRCTDQFFRPLHQQLATQTLSSFVWLSDDGLLQQTGFSDGSTLSANFDGKPRMAAGVSLAAHSVSAHLATGWQGSFSSDDCQ